MVKALCCSFCGYIDKGSSSVLRFLSIYGYILSRRVRSDPTAAACGDQPVTVWTVSWRTAPSLSSAWASGSSSGTWEPTPCLRPPPSTACLPPRSTTTANRLSGQCEHALYTSSCNNVALRFYVSQEYQYF